VPAGGCVCPDCRPPGAAHPALATLDLLVALAEADWTVADASEPPARREASGLIAAHLQWHLERGLRSLPLVDRSVTGPPSTGGARVSERSGAAAAGPERSGGKPSPQGAAKRANQEQR
jgi:DNA repair protein RecO (recombination protein O)